MEGDYQRPGWELFRQVITYCIRKLLYGQLLTYDFRGEICF